MLVGSTSCRQPVTNTQNRDMALSLHGWRSINLATILWILSSLLAAVEYRLEVSSGGVSSRSELRWSIV